MIICSKSFIYKEIKLWTIVYLFDSIDSIWSFILRLILEVHIKKKGEVEYIIVDAVPVGSQSLYKSKQYYNCKIKVWLSLNF